MEEDPENVTPTFFTKMFKGEEAEILTFKEVRDAAQGYIIAGTDVS